jgi:NAD(P)-dependent dehydrogenase (short-subunit alcohol dehydrogenase family)
MTSTDIDAGSTASLNLTHAAHAPVAVFVGGTSGIGQGMAEVFAEQTSGKSHIIIVGRNRAAAERILDALAKPPSQSAIPSATTPSEQAGSSSASYAREFVECDATLMKNVDRATKEILARHKEINYLVISCGFSALGGRDETSEGIDKKLAVHYYARWKFIGDLLPALERARSGGKEATVMSVMAPSYGGEIDVNNLDLKKSYSAPKAALVAPTYNDLMMEVSLHLISSFQS